MDPHVNHSNSEKRVEAGGQTFPADDQAAVLALEPGKGALGLEARDILFDRTPTRFSGLPHPFGDLGADPALAEAPAEVFGIIALICRQDLAACPVDPCVCAGYPAAA
jgi:hypothetical protein